MSKRYLLAAALFVVKFVGDLVFDEFDDSGFVAEYPGDDLLRMFQAFRFDDRPCRMVSVFTAPLKLMQIPCSVDFLHRSVAIFSCVR